MSAEEDIRGSLMKMLDNLNTIAKARCFSGKYIRFSYVAGNAAPLADLAHFVERKSADLAQQIARIALRVCLQHVSNDRSLTPTY